MRRWIQQLWQDYLDTRQTSTEDFMEWFFKRRLGFWGKLTTAYLLWAIWLFFFSRPALFLYFLYLVLGLSLLVALVELGKKKDGTGRQGKRR